MFPIAKYKNTGFGRTSEWIVYHNVTLIAPIDVCTEFAVVEWNSKTNKFLVWKNESDYFIGWFADYEVTMSPPYSEIKRKPIKSWQGIFTYEDKKGKEYRGCIYQGKQYDTISVDNDGTGLNMWNKAESRTDCVYLRPVVITLEEWKTLNTLEPSNGD